MSLSSADIDLLRRSLLTWYDREGRTLPVAKSPRSLFDLDRRNYAATNPGQNGYSLL